MAYPQFLESQHINKRILFLWNCQFCFRFSETELKFDCAGLFRADESMFIEEENYIYVIFIRKAV